MKKIVLIIVFIGILFPVFSESWATEKAREFGRENSIKEGNFAFVVAPLTEELVIGKSYGEWIQKRYSETEMIKEAKELINYLDNGMMATLAIMFTGDYNSKGRTSIEIPSDFYKYIFAENERGEYLRCISTGENSNYSDVDCFNESELFVLTFSKLTDDGKDIFENAKELIFVIEGLDIEQNRISYSLPLSNYFTDMPEDIRRIFVTAKNQLSQSSSVNENE